MTDVFVTLAPSTPKTWREGLAERMPHLVCMTFDWNTDAYAYFTSRYPAMDKPRAACIIKGVNDRGEREVEVWLSDAQLELMLDRTMGT